MEQPDEEPTGDPVDLRGVRAQTPAEEIRDRVDLRGVRALLLDADDNLFASEEPAFVASTRVVNRLMKAIGCDLRFTPEQLRRTGTGLSFRALAAELADACERPLKGEELERWVREETLAVTRHLGETLSPDPAVAHAVRRLSERYALAVVSSSALERLAVSFTATGLDELLPPERRVSAEDSLPRPTSKPDPAVYREALARLGVAAGEALAVEDSPTGAASAVAAGIPTLGNICFVPEDERAARAAELRRTGVVAVVDTWAAVEVLLLG